MKDSGNHALAYFIAIICSEESDIKNGSEKFIRFMQDAYKIPGIDPAKDIILFFQGFSQYFKTNVKPIRKNKIQEKLFKLGDKHFLSCD